MPPVSGEMVSLKGPAIGIDLGTWKCCVAVFREGKVEIIKNERGSMTTPSYVAFTETERLVGEDAKDQVSLNPTNTVFGVKRIIGRRFDDPHVKTNLGNFPFTTKQVCGSERTEIRVQYRRESKCLPPEHLTAMLLRKMRLTAEAYLGCPVKEAVVSIPVCFNSAQRQATLDAAEIAGLKVLQLLHEPTAVALAYKDQAGSGALNQTVIVVDAGGGTLQAAVAYLKDGLVDVKAVSGNAQFGGCDLDQFLVDECSKRLQITQVIDISINKKAKERLRVACHKAKCDLTLLPQTTIQVDSLVKDTDFETTIHREEFNKLFRERSDKLITEVVKDALKGAHLHVDQIDRVLVVGGSSRIPAIITLLEGLFPGKNLNLCVNIDEAVAHGAALQAALLAGDHTVADTSISDVTPRDLYLEHASNRTERGIVFGKNCTIPLKKIWNVSCGISRKQTLNLLEDDFGLKPIKSYELQFSYLINNFRKEKVLIKIDRNGLISELPAPLHKSGSVSVPKSYNGISDVQPHIRAEKSFQFDEKNEAMRLQASMKLESTCIEIKSAVKGFQNRNGGQKFIKTYGKKCSGLVKSCNECIDWLDNNPNVSMRKCDSKTAELEERFEVLSVAFNSVIRIKSEGNEATQNNTKPARQSKNRPPKNNVPKSMLAAEEHFLSVPDRRRSRFPQASDASAMHGGGIDSRFPQASDTSAMHGGGIDSRFSQASDTSAMHGGGIDSRFSQASDTSAMYGGGIDSRFPQASDASAMHGGGIDSRFTQASDASAMHGGGTDSRFPQASDASAMHGGGIDIAIVKYAVAIHPPETGKAQFNLQNQQFDAQNERSASPSISSKSDQVQRVGITKRDEYPRFTVPNLPSPDDSNSLTSAMTLPSETRKLSVTGSSPAFPQNGAVSQKNHLVCDSRASRSSSECDVTSEDKTQVDSVGDRKSVVRKQTKLRSPKPETCLSNQSSVVLADAKSANLSARILRNVTSGEKLEGSFDTSGTNSEDKRGGGQGCEECNSTTFFKQDTEASHKLLVSEQGSVAKHAIKDNRQTTYSRLPKTVNTETSSASNQANSIGQQIEERPSTTSNSSEISSSKTASGIVTSPGTTARSTVTSLRAIASGSVTSPSTTASDLVTSFRTTPSGSFTSPSTTDSSSATSHSKISGGSATSSSTKASSSVTRLRTTDCKQGSDNSKSQVPISSSLTLYSKVHNKSKTETGIGVDVYDADEKNCHSPVRVQENTKANDLISNQNQPEMFKKRSRKILAEYTFSPETCKIFGGEVDSCEQIVKKQCLWNPNSEFISNSSMNSDGDNSCINRKDVCDRRNLAIKNGAKQSDEGSSVSGGNGEVNRVDGRQDGGRSVSLERMRRLTGEGRQGETSAGNEATSEAKGDGYGPVRKHPRDAGPVTTINERPCFLVRRGVVEIQQEKTSKQLNDSTEAQKITQPLQSSPRKSRVIHTGSTKSTRENKTTITVVKQATSQLKSQSTINEFNTSKLATASPQPLSTPHQHNSRPEKLPNQGHYQQQLFRPHGTSQQNTSSTHQRKDPAIGIDLGTWKCCVAVVREGKVEIIENEQGSKTTPSYVAFTETERLVGEDAKNQLAINPTNTVFGVKRIIGREFSDQSLQKDMKFWPFTVTPEQHDRPRIRLEYREQKKVLSPEQVSAMMLEKMKRIAESHLGCEVRDAVISVPAYFNNSQRQATKDAGAIAGLNVLGLINEPTAAALAYRDNKARVEPHNVLIFDLGGGTFDVAVIRVDESGVKVKGVCGDAEFGGNEMDVLLMKHFDEEFFKKHGKSVLQDKKGLERLRTASEKAKMTLSLLPKANVQVDSLIEETDFSASITRHDFEQLFYTDAKERIVNVLTNVLKRATIPPSKIDEVILVGGTSRIPKIQSILKEFFVGKALNKTVNPDEAVAHGAALLATLLAGDIEVEKVYVDDMFQVHPSMEIERMDGKFRNYRAIPKESFYILNCSIKDEDEESEERFSHKERVMKIHRLNSFGIFEIFALGNENAKGTRMPEIGCLAEPEITQLADQVHQFAKDDLELKEGVAAMSDLEALCFKTKALVTSNSLRRKLGQGELRGIADRCEEMICWLDDNDSATKTEYQHKKRELCCKILSVMEKGDVKMEDFYVTEQEWFRELLKSQSEKSTQIHELKQLQQLTRQPLSPIKEEQLPSPSKQEQPEPPQQPPVTTKQEQPEPTQQLPSPTKHEQHDPPQLTMQPPTAPTRQVQPEPSQPTQPSPAQTKQEQPKPTQQSAPGNPMLSISYDPSNAPPHQVKLVSAQGAATQAHASEAVVTTLQSNAPPHQVKLVSAQGAATQAHASEPVVTTLQSNAPPHQVKLVSAQGAATQAHASEPVITTLQSNEDSKHKIEDDSADYRAAETEGGRQSSLQNCLGYAVELPQPSENVLKSSQFKRVSYTNDNPETRPKALQSYLFTPPTNLTSRVDSFTPNAQGAGNRLGPLSTVSRIVSSSIANQSLSLSVVPAIAFSTEHTSLEFTGTSSSDSGSSSPCVPDFSARTEFLESNIISLNGVSISSAASHLDSQLKSIESRPPRSVVKSIGGVDSAQEMLMAGLRPARANSCNINNGVEIKSINDKTIESNEPIKNQQQQPLGADDSRVEAYEAAVVKAFDALVEPHALEQEALGNARRSCIGSTSAENSELRDESKCNIGQVHKQVTKPLLTSSTLMPPGCLEQGFSCPQDTVLPQVRLMHQCSGSSDLSTKSICYYCSEETDYSYDCRTKEDSQLHFSARNEQKVPFGSLFEQFVKNSANDPITCAQKSFPSQFGAAVSRRDSQELFNSPITQQNHGKNNYTLEGQFSGQNTAASYSITRNSVPQVFTNSNQTTTTFHNKCEISSHIPKLASTNSGNGLQQQVRPEHRNRLPPLSSGTSPPAPRPASAEQQPLNSPVLQQGRPEHHHSPPPLSSGTSPPAPRPSSAEEQSLNSSVLQQWRPEHHHCPPLLSSDTSPSAPRPSSTEEQPLNSHVRQRPWSAILVRPQEGHRFQPYTGIGDLERGRRRSACDTGREDELPPPGIVHQRIRFFSNRKK